MLNKFLIEIGCLKEMENLKKLKYNKSGQQKDYGLESYYSSLVGFDQKKFYANEIYRRNQL